MKIQHLKIKELQKSVMQQRKESRFQVKQRRNLSTAKILPEFEFDNNSRAISEALVRELQLTSGKNSCALSFYYMRSLINIHVILYDYECCRVCMHAWIIILFLIFELQVSLEVVLLVLAMLCGMQESMLQ